MPHAENLSKVQWKMIVDMKGKGFLKRVFHEQDASYMVCRKEKELLSGHHIESANSSFSGAAAQSEGCWGV